MSKFSNALADQLALLNKPVVTAIDVYRAIDEMHLPENREGLYLRQTKPEEHHYTKYAKQLFGRHGISPTPRQGVWRVSTIPALLPEEMVCLSDPFLYVSHLSAMRTWQLTNRIPKALTFTRLRAALIKEKLLADCPPQWPQPVIPLTTRNIGRFSDLNIEATIAIMETKTPSPTIELGGSHTRVTTQAATFVDMIKKPSLCGGMNHVLDIFDQEYRQRGRRLHSDVVRLIDADDTPAIVKVRAGYILSERLGMTSETIDRWTHYAARGGSRKLDPERGYKPTFSEKWMISLNVE